MAAMKMIVVLLVCFLLSQSFGASHFRKQRALPKGEPIHTAPPTPSAEQECMGSTPCGWAVYHRYTRDIDYFMKNKCECTNGKRCVRTDDDLSVTAYVYRCKEGDLQKDSDES